MDVELDPTKAYPPPQAWRAILKHDSRGMVANTTPRLRCACLSEVSCIEIYALKAKQFAFEVCQALLISPHILPALWCDVRRSAGITAMASVEIANWLCYL